MSQTHAVWQIIAAVGFFGAVVSTAFFIIGWYRTEKDWRKLDVAMIFFGALTLFTGLATFTTSFTVSWLTQTQNTLLGLAGAPTGATVMFAGMMRPCMFDIALEEGRFL